MSGEKVFAQDVLAIRGVLGVAALQLRADRLRLRGTCSVWHICLNNNGAFSEVSPREPEARPL